MRTRAAEAVRAGCKKAAGGGGRVRRVALRARGGLAAVGGGLLGGGAPADVSLRLAVLRMHACMLAQRCSPLGSPLQDPCTEQSKRFGGVTIDSRKHGLTTLVRRGWKAA